MIITYDFDFSDHFQLVFFIGSEMYIVVIDDEIMRRKEFMMIIERMRMWLAEEQMDFEDLNEVDR